MSQSDTIIMQEARLLLNRIIKSLDVRVCDIPKALKLELNAMLWAKPENDDAEDVKEMLANNTKKVRHAIRSWIKKTKYVKPVKAEKVEEEEVEADE